MEAAGHVHPASAYLIADRIGAQHEPSVTGPLPGHRFLGQGRTAGLECTGGGTKAHSTVYYCLKVPQIYLHDF